MTLSSSSMITEGIVKRAVRPDLSQFEPRFRDTSPSGIASQPTGNGRPRISRTAHISSGTSIRTTSRFQGSVAPRPKCALVSQAASEIDVAECEELKALGAKAKNESVTMQRNAQGGGPLVLHRSTLDESWLYQFSAECDALRRRALTSLVPHPRRWAGAVRE